MPPRTTIQRLSAVAVAAAGALVAGVLAAPPAYAADVTNTIAQVQGTNVATSPLAGQTVTVEGVALTASDFHDGGGYIVDESAGIAVLVDGGGFVRGDRLRVSGTVDDRFSQRTIRAGASGVTVIGAGADPQPRDAATGSIGEPDEGQLVHVSGALTSGASALTTGSLAPRVSARDTTVQGQPGVEVRVEADVPALGLWGPAVHLDVTGHAVKEVLP